MIDLLSSIEYIGYSKEQILAGKKLQKIPGIKKVELDSNFCLKIYGSLLRNKELLYLDIVDSNYYIRVDRSGRFQLCQYNPLNPTEINAPALDKALSELPKETATRLCFILDDFKYQKAL